MPPPPVTYYPHKPLASLLLLPLVALANAQAWLDLPGSLYGPPEQPWGPSCADDHASSSWPVTTALGQAITPQAPDDQLVRALAEVDAVRVEAVVATLVGFGTRHTLSQQDSPTRGIGAARDWIYREMQAYAAAEASATPPRMDVYLDTYTQPVASGISFPVNLTNVVARINGTTDPNRVYIVMAHYDSRNLDGMDYTGDSPGADDNASGVAVVLELARICALLPPSAATVLFVATAGEEQGLYGARHLAETLKAAGADVQGVLNNDIVGTGLSAPFEPINNYTVRLFGASSFYNLAAATEDYQQVLAEIARVGYEDDSPARNLGRFVSEVAAGAARAAEMQVALVRRPDRFLRGGDHQAFLAAGFPGAVRFTEAVEDFAHQHQDVREAVDERGVVTQYGDLARYVDAGYAQRVARVNLASLWSLANAPRAPRNLTLSRAVGFPAASADTPREDVSNESQLAWVVDDDDDPFSLVASYELVWRSSGALQWARALDVGKVGGVRVDLPKDAVQFGVRAVGRDGRKSPAAMPFPA